MVDQVVHVVFVETEKFWRKRVNCKLVNFLMSEESPIKAEVGLRFYREKLQRKTKYQEEIGLCFHEVDLSVVDFQFNQFSIAQNWNTRNRVER